MWFLTSKGNSYGFTGERERGESLRQLNFDWALVIYKIFSLVEAIDAGKPGKVDMLWPKYILNPLSTAGSYLIFCE